MVAMRNYLTILLCVGACLLWTVPAYAAKPYAPVHPDPILLRCLDGLGQLRFPETYAITSISAGMAMRRSS